MTPQDRSVNINMSGIPVAGVGGLGLVAMVVVISLVLPAAWWLMVCGAVGGTILGVVLVYIRRNHPSTGPSGDDPTVLFRSEVPQNRATARLEPPGRPHIEELVAAR